MKTIEKLERHWYQLDGAAAAAAGPSTGAGEPIGESEDSCESDDEGPPKKQLKATVNKVCVHVACSAQTVCLIEQLQIVRDNYRGRIDQFRIKVGPILHAHCKCCRHLLEVHPAQLCCSVGCCVASQLCTTSLNLTAQIIMYKYCCFYKLFLASENQHSIHHYRVWHCAAGLLVLSILVCLLSIPVLIPVSDTCYCCHQ